MAVVTDRPAPLRPLLAASVRGLAAAWLWRRVQAEATGAPAAVARVAGDRAGRELELALAELREAAVQWEERVTEGPVAVIGSSETVLGETRAQSAVMEIGTSEAAAVLGVTTRRVGQLAQAGVLVGRKVGRQWMLSRASVLDYRAAKGDAA